ncbi:MAG TPA: amino acid ABC transporter permease [Marmoricola sp.]|jgi:glutamate transport system permease protein|nr:amino acid ABC transporter permease [Marmoricola sp.]
MAVSVLFDEPGPKARARFWIYNIVFALIVAGLLWYVIAKFNDAGQFEPRIYERLSESGVITEIQQGLVSTLKAAGIAIVLSLVVGILLAVGRLSDRAWIRLPATAFVEFFRAIPLVLLIIFFFLFLAYQTSWGSQTQGLVSLVTGLTLYNGSVLCEVFRAGVNAVPKGQGEAAYAVGMRKSQVMSIVLIPQAVKFMLPAIISQCVVVLKDTSLGYIVTYTELLRGGRTIAQYVDSFLITYLLLALVYIAMNSVLSGLAYWLERRLSSSGRSAVRAVEQVEEQLPVG